jgi:hypothetical protein
VPLEETVDRVEVLEISRSWPARMNDMRVAEILPSRSLGLRLARVETGDSSSCRIMGWLLPRESSAMGPLRTHAVVGLLGAVAGALVAVLAVTIEEPGRTEMGDRGEVTPRRETPRLPYESRGGPAAVTGELGVTEAALGTEATDEELVFLREALGAERERRRRMAEDAAERARLAPVRPEDDGLAVMSRYLESGGDVSEVVSSYAAMRAHVRAAPGPVRQIASDGERTAVDLTAVAADKMLLPIFG